MKSGILSSMLALIAFPSALAAGNDESEQVRRISEKVKAPASKDAGPGINFTTVPEPAVALLGGLGLLILLLRRK